MKIFCLLGVLTLEEVSAAWAGKLYGWTYNCIFFCHISCVKGVVNKILEAVAEFWGRFLNSGGSITLENTRNLLCQITLKIKKYSDMPE